MTGPAYFNFPTRPIECAKCGKHHPVEIDLEGFDAETGIYHEGIICCCGAVTSLVFSGFDEDGGYNFFSVVMPDGVIGDEWKKQMWGDRN